MRFTEFLEQSLLSEALNSPVEYYMTDDTVIPTALYGAFDIDGFHYIMKLEQCKTQGLYVLEVGRTTGNGGKVVWMKFHKPNHILSVLATTMHFAQACSAILGPKAKGVAVRFRNNTDKELERATRLAERILKRSYLTSFTVVPVAQPKEMTTEKTSQYKLWRHVFVVKKGVSASNVFSGLYYKKYDFDGNSPIPQEALADLEPKKIEKPMKTLKPSSKHSFGKYDVDTPLDPDFIEKIKDVKPVSPGAEKAKDPTSSSYEKEIEDLTKGVGSAKAGVLMALPSLKNMVSAIQKKGFDPDSLNWDNLKYVIDKASQVEKEILSKYAMDGTSTNNQKAKWVAFMQNIESNPSYLTKWWKGEAEKFIAANPSGAPTSETGSTSSGEVLASTIKIEDLVATAPGVGTLGEFSGKYFQAKGQNYEMLSQHLELDLGYSKEISEMKNLSNLTSYSGNKFSNYNNPLRIAIGKLFKEEPLSADEIKNITSNTKMFMKLFSMFDKIKPLPDSLWVYRGTFLSNNMIEKITPGYDFVDPAFLSTSIKNTISFGSQKMRIFLPKGSKVIPVLNHSKHSNEKEILLPPSSVIKVVEVIKDGNNFGFSGVFTGSAHKSIVDMLKKQLTMAEDYGSMVMLKRFIETIEEEHRDMNEESKKYDANDKFGGGYDAELGELITKAIKSGKVKVDSPKKDK